MSCSNFVMAQLSLIAADTCQGLAVALNVRWIDEQHVACSPYCTAQGVISVIGETGSAMTTIVRTSNSSNKLFPPNLSVR